MNLYARCDTYIYDVLTVGIQLADVLRDRGCQAGARQAGQGGLELRLQAGDRAIDARDLPKRPALDAVVSAEALQGGRGDAQSLSGTIDM